MNEKGVKGYRDITLELPTDYSDEELEAAIGSCLGIRDFTFQIQAKSLDARKKSRIHWRIQAGVLSAELSGKEPPAEPVLEIPFRKREETVLVVGSGPAGFFAGLVLANAGFSTRIIEQGSEVKRRRESIRTLESGHGFDPNNNYAFGEGGAGTFSDGKLTARTKRTAAEKTFILNSYIRAGAPEEIRYLAHPHLGTDNLRQIVRNLGREFQEQGGEILFDTCLTDLVIRNGTVVSAVTTAGEIEADIVIIAPGHSSYPTFRMLIRSGVRFRPKPFAIGSRVEHPQEIINRAQWGRPSLPGVKAAEYRLTSRAGGRLPVYTFCMCPGGTVVPATSDPQANIVNGMSRYRRNGRFANAACVAAIDLEAHLKRQLDPLESLDWLAALEHRFYSAASGYRAPFSTIEGFMKKRMPAAMPMSSYPLGLVPAPLWELLPKDISRSMAAGLAEFTKKIRGFDTGIILGLESKTSAPVQALREPGGLCSKFSNLYLAGEGSGWSGGIISSGVDGIRCAMDVIRRLS